MPKRPFVGGKTKAQHEADECRIKYLAIGLAVGLLAGIDTVLMMFAIAH